MYKSTLQEICAKRFQTTPVYNTLRVGGQPHAPQWQCHLYVPNGIKVVKKLQGSKKQVENYAAQEALEVLQTTHTTSKTKNSSPRLPTEFNDSRTSLQNTLKRSAQFLPAVVGAYDDISSPRSPPDVESLLSSKLLPEEDWESFPVYSSSNSQSSSGNEFVLPPEVTLFIDIENRGDIKYCLPNLSPRSQIHGFVANHYDLNQVEKLSEHCQMHIIPSTRKDAADIGIMIEGTKQAMEHKLDKLWLLSKDKFAEAWKEIMMATFPHLDIKIFPTISHLEKYLA
jgi:hypothetical protein